MLRWTAAELAGRAKTGVQTIKRFEAVDGIPPSRSSTLMDVKAALEAGGLEFVGTPVDRPGVRMATTAKSGRQESE
jgi:hypothetical protein